ncbi:MAG: hypothetical protein WD648_03270 [Planctomycetaceae bacterium]
MRNHKRMSVGRAALAVFVGSVTLASWSWGASTRSIEAERGKQYQLTKEHGPWMIMVANFRSVREEDRTEGMSPKEAADELVFELRSKGIPAYACSQGSLSAQLGEQGAIPGQKARGKYRPQEESITVLAGNYESPEDKVAQKTLAHIKKYQPKFMRGGEKKGRYINKLSNGGVYRKTPGRPGPLSGAFLTINPTLTPEEARQKKGSPLLVKLNSGGEYSLLENPGQFTLIVASFYGKAVTLSRPNRISTVSGGAVNMTPENRLQAIKENFKVSDALDKAAEDAWELAKTLRQTRGIPAYVWHDEHRSIVTVGSFQSPNDSRINEWAEKFGAKVRQHPVTKQEILAAEAVTIPQEIKPGMKPEKQWILDPVPKLMKVPTL